MPAHPRLRGEVLVGAAEVLPKVEARKIRTPASLARIGGVAEDGGELPQPIPAALERLSRRLKLAHGYVIQGGEGLVQMLVDVVARLPGRRPSLEVRG